MHTTAAILLLTGMTGPSPEPITTRPEPARWHVPQQLPQPRVKVDLPPGISFYRPSAYDVWQNLAVGRRGEFLPRVRTTPHAAFYQHDGSIYWWTTTRAMDWIPYVKR
jgi:hypothetical protein